MQNRRKLFTIANGEQLSAVQKIADALEVSIDYLVGKTSILLDKQTIDRIENIAQLPEEKRS